MREKGYNLGRVPNHAYSAISALTAVPFRAYNAHMGLRDVINDVIARAHNAHVLRLSIVRASVKRG